MKLEERDSHEELEELRSKIKKEKPTLIKKVITKQIEEKVEKSIADSGLDTRKDIIDYLIGLLVDALTEIDRLGGRK